MPHIARPQRNFYPPVVVADPVKDLGLEYTSFKEEVIPGSSGRSWLLEDLINARNVDIDVMDGYSPHIGTCINKHSIYHLYEFERRTCFLDRIPRNTIGRFPDHELMSTRFLLCRYVLCLIDEAMHKHKPVQLLAMRLNGDIQIGANKSQKLASDEQNESAFGGLNFAKKVTSGDPSFEKHHSVVKELRLENCESRKGMCLYVSSIVRAFDELGKPVELKTVSSEVVGKLQNMSGHKARSWWLRALLSGSERIVYGMRSRNRIVYQLNEASLLDFTDGHFQFSAADLFSFVFDMFETINYSIPNNGDMCLVRTNGGKPIIETTDSTILKTSPFW